MRHEWTKEEETKLKELTGQMSFEELYRKHFTYRSKHSLARKSYRMGLVSDYHFKKHSHDESFFTNLNMVNCYYGGFSAGDCQMNRNIYTLSLASKDLGLLEDMQKLTKFTGKIRTYKRTKYKNPELKDVSTLNICGAQQWTIDLEKHFSITPQKTKRLPPPNLPNDTLMLAYMVGLIDADGWITRRTKKNYVVIGFISCSYALVKWMTEQFNRFFAQFFAKNGGENKKTITIYKKRDKNCYYFTIHGRRASLIINCLKDLPVPKLKRKWFREDILPIIEEHKQKHPDIFSEYTYEEFIEKGIIDIQEVEKSKKILETLSHPTPASVKGVKVTQN